MSVHRSRDPATATLHLKFLDIRLDLTTNSLAAASRLAAYFRGYLTVPERGPVVRLYAMREEPVYDKRSLKVWPRPLAPGRVPKESYYDRRRVRYILKNRTNMLIKIGSDEAAISGDIDRHLNQVVNLTNTLFGLALVGRGYAMLHASAVVTRGTDEVMIFMGNSGSGKSSLALQLIEHGGYDYVSNDRVLVRALRGSVHVVGLPKKPRVNPGTLLASQMLSRLLPARKRPAYEGMPPAELWNVEDKHDVDVQRVLGAGERLDGRLARAYSLEWRPAGAGLHVEPLDAAGALAAMRSTHKDFGAFDLSLAERDAEREFRRVARIAEFVRVTGKADPRRFARELVGTAAPAR